MEALRASYGSGSDSGDDDADGGELVGASATEVPVPLPSPPLDLLRPSNSLAFSSAAQGNRIRSFPHVEGNYALHVFIPVFLPSATKKQLAPFMKKLASIFPGLYVVDADIALSELSKDDEKLEQILLGREFHISLGRTVPIQVHQFDTIVAMLRQKFLSQKRFLIEFTKWDAFLNDEQARSFLSLEVLGRGLSEISKQVHVVDEVYRMHGLPEFYKNPRPHISLLWALGDVSHTLKQAIEGLDRSHNISRTSESILQCKFSGIECRIGKKLYNICKPLG